MTAHFPFLLLTWSIYAHGGYSATSNTALPLSIPPSLFWDGDNGRWSTFQIQVGTPGQTVRLLPGTSASAGSTIWVVNTIGCTDTNPTLTTCQSDRGYLFQSNLSTTWSTQGLQTGIDGAIFALNTVEESKLSLGGDASYGYDTVSLGLPGAGLPILRKQVIASMWTNDWFLGSLGLSPVPFNFSNLNDPQPSVLGTLYNQSLVPSISWGYTAGAYYKSPPVFGSLTFGGYDSARYTPRGNNLTFAFGADFSRDLLVSLQSITYDTAASYPLLAKSIDMFIDSMVAEIWLPVPVCEAFAQQFNLTWNVQGQLYLVSETAHEALLAQNPTFTFAIGQAGGGGQTIDIALPYAAFDLNLTAPIVGSGNNARYFPLKQAQNYSQFVLGRVFLQEAYVIADYERHNFSVSQALFPLTSVPQNLVAIHSPSQAAERSGRSLATGAIVGIVVGMIVALAMGLCVGWYWWKHHWRDATVQGDSPRTTEEDKGGIRDFDGQHLDMAELQQPDNVQSWHELTSEAKVHELGDSRRQLVELEGS